jgi:RsiW-degrading membrane proteinase PrsW (M82 family)
VRLPAVRHNVPVANPGGPEPLIVGAPAGPVGGPHSGAQPGWYPDPWRVVPWRWWDGRTWTAHVARASERKPRLPAWLSPPVLVAAVLTVPLVIILLITSPLAVLAGLVPLVIVWPAMAWLDRVEPEPRSSRIHAVLWGATVAGTVSAVVNSIVFVSASEAVAAVVSAPLIEEATKGLGVYWAVRRREVDGVIDGIVYAGWVALGFAVVEDFTYFASAADEGMLVPVFILRALLTPFAHPLFTSWIGLAIGLAVARRRPVLLHALWGYVLAVACHAAWNGSLTFADSSGNGGAIAIAALCFVALFVAVAVALMRIRRQQRQQFERSVPALAARYGIPPAEAQLFAQWPSLLRSRRQLPRGQRRRFDAVHASLARLALLHERPGPRDGADEARLAEQLARARSGGKG